MWGRNVLLFCCRARNFGNIGRNTPLTILQIRSFSLAPRAPAIRLLAARGGVKWLLGVGVAGGFVAYRLLRPQTAACKQLQNSSQSQRVVASPHAPTDSNQAFDWALFAKFIWPDWFVLLVAIGVGVALVTTCRFMYSVG